MAADRSAARRTTLVLLAVACIAGAIWLTAIRGDDNAPDAGQVRAQSVARADRPKATTGDAARPHAPATPTRRAKPNAAPPTHSTEAQPDSEALLLPTLGVAAPVVKLPVTTDGVLNPPDDYTKVGLWPLAAQPGDAMGTAIIAGHTVHTGGGALDHLEDLVPGDEVVVQQPGPDLTYRVSTVEIYEKSTLSHEAESIFSQSVEGRLALVTCEDWDGSAYRSNVVVIAEPA